MNSKEGRSVIKIKKATIFFKRFSILFSIVILSVFIFSYTYISNSVDEVLIRYQDLLTLEEASSYQLINNSSSDVLFLKDLLLTYAGKSGALIPRDYQRLTEKFYHFARRRKLYDKIRFLNAQGMEKIRITYRNDKARVISKNQLQKKTHRNYFKDTILLKNDEIYISRLDLNVERKQIETPFRPMIRFVTPVFRANGELLGVIVLNYNANVLLSRIRNLDKFEKGSVMLVNKKGYFLIGPTAEDEWGFMVSNRRHKTMATLFPAIWFTAKNLQNNVIKTTNGIFITRKLRGISDQAKKQLHMQFVWFIPWTDIIPKNYNYYYFDFLLAFLFMLAVSWLWSVARIRKLEYENLLDEMATTDALTRLPNRRLFKDRLKQAMVSADRHKTKVGVFYFDLDHFKQVNDNFGHDVGDLLLIEVASRLKALLRKEDTVARFGGDEFAIIAKFEKDSSALETIAKKIILKLDKPFVINGNKINIGVSIGISICPDHTKDMSLLLKYADEALYTSKEAGRNQFHFAKVT